MRIFYHSLPKSGDNISVKRRLAIRMLKFHDKRDLVLRTMLDRLHSLEKQCTPLEEHFLTIGFFEYVTSPVRSSYLNIICS
jgi:hypothetical protein